MFFLFVFASCFCSPEAASNKTLSYNLPGCAAPALSISSSKLDEPVACLCRSSISFFPTILVNATSDDSNHARRTLSRVFLARVFTKQENALFLPFQLFRLGLSIWLLLTWLNANIKQKPLTNIIPIHSNSGEGALSICVTKLASTTSL